MRLPRAGGNPPPLAAFVMLVFFFPYGRPLDLSPVDKRMRKGKFVPPRRHTSTIHLMASDGQVRDLLRRQKKSGTAANTIVITEKPNSKIASELGPGGSLALSYVRRLRRPPRRPTGIPRGGSRAPPKVSLSLCCVLRFYAADNGEPARPACPQLGLSGSPLAADRGRGTQRFLLTCEKALRAFGHSDFANEMHPNRSHRNAELRQIVRWPLLILPGSSEVFAVSTLA